jgi:hypothetical protein
MNRGFFIAAAIVIVLVAVAAGNGPMMMRALETGLARGVGYQIAHGVFHGAGIGEPGIFPVQSLLYDPRISLFSLVSAMGFEPMTL